MKKIKYVYGAETNSLFDVVKNKKCEVLKSYWYNGEGYYKLKDEDGKVFDSPDIFWNDTIVD